MNIHTPEDIKPYAREEVIKKLCQVIPNFGMLFNQITDEIESGGIRSWIEMLRLTISRDPGGVVRACIKLESSLNKSIPFSVVFEWGHEGQSEEQTKETK